MRVLVVVLLPALGACHLRHSARPDECSPTAPYTRAQIVPSLHAADGLPAPNTKNALKVPDDVALAKPHKAGSACLDEPPSFYADRPRPPPPKK
jgi:hypothetical protein